MTESDNIMAPALTSKLPKAMPTVFQSSAISVYPNSFKNVLGIWIFVCHICNHKEWYHAKADAHIRENHTHMKYCPFGQCGFTTYNGELFRNHLKNVHKKSGCA